MGRNILIFSDGTGQAGGLLPDELRTNIYKLYRATRCGPDSDVDPERQVAFYDPGLGTQSDAGRIEIGAWKWFKMLLSSATGLGISRNIADCYAAILNHWAAGDRIFLFGFSRGAYTVRCLGAALVLCGIPTAAPGGGPLKRDPKSLRRIADEAVAVYMHGASVTDPAAKAELEKERNRRAEAFRRKYSCAESESAFPYFIGVFDTVAAMGIPRRKAVTLGLAAIVGLVMVGMLLKYFWPTMLIYAGVIAAVALVGGLYAYMMNWVYYLPQLRCWPYRAGWTMQFYSDILSPKVRWARHAIAIDEHREDFHRVKWKIDKTNPQTVEKRNGDRDVLKQLWFAGCHADIGGGYDEHEARLSDISLKWMLDEIDDVTESDRLAGHASAPPLTLTVRYLQLRPSPRGRQHDEAKAGIELFGWFTLPWAQRPRDVPPTAILHSTVVQRFAEAEVLQYDIRAPYRPPELSQHQDVSSYYPSA